METIWTWYLVPVVATPLLAAWIYIKAYRYVHEYRNIFKEIGLNEMPDTPWLGGWSSWMKGADMFQVEIDVIKKYGKTFGYFEGRHPAIMVADIDFLKHVMIKDHEHFYDRRLLFKSRKSSLDIALTNLTGARWKHVRQQLTPVFTPANLRRMEPLLMKVADQLCSNVGKQADSKQPFDIKEYAGCFTLDAIASVAFALEIDSFNSQNSIFVANVKKVFASFSLNGKLIAFLLVFPEAASILIKSLPDWASPSKVITFFQKMMENEIARRKSSGKQPQRHDLLAQLLPVEKDPKDPANKPFVDYDELGDIWLHNGLKTEEIVAQSVLFFLAGYETTANSIMVTLLSLAEHPEIQERLYDELSTAFNNEKKGITLETLNEIKYLDMVINESLRLYCPVLRVDRMCTGDTEYNGMRIPKGMTMVIPVNAIHHDPELWPEPDKFDPERFSPENMENIPQMAFIPFGAGNRNCIGMRLAQVEMKLAVARLVLGFKFAFAPETELPIRWLSTGFRTPHCKIMLQPQRRATTSH